ncbi:MAG: hypothetical protein LBQ47_06500 [Endomicrobium sp.]|jgi:hypothetical protein|nr:hypothetical protein [Endomicrobium sp.]
MIDKSSVAKFKARQLEYEKTINKIVNNFLKTAVAVKPQIAIKQMSAFINYSEGIPKGDFLGDISRISLFALHLIPDTLQPNLPRSLASRRFQVGNLFDSSHIVFPNKKRASRRRAPFSSSIIFEITDTFLFKKNASHALITACKVF